MSDIGRCVTCTKRPWRRCTLDGVVEATGAVWEAKHTSAFAKPEEVLERYMPQLQHNMAVAGAERAVLSVIFGNHKYEIIEVAADWLYQLELLEAEEEFWDCVQTGREPCLRRHRRHQGRSGPAKSASRATTPGLQQRSTGSRTAMLQRCMLRGHLDQEPG